MSSTNTPAERVGVLSRIFNGRDLLASVVVFLVALPLCMGIALASGVPPALGLVTGIVGGLVIGSLAGSPLQVSGPAAGLAVLCWQLVNDFGLAMLGVAVLGAGLLQLIAGSLKVGRWFRAVSPAVIQGMLAGIGVLIFASQFHVMVDDKPQGSGLTNLLTIPQAIYKGLAPADGSSHHLAAIIGIVTIVSLVVWNNFKPRKLSMIPGPLVAVIVAAVAAAVGGLTTIAFVDVPSDLTAALNVPELSAFTALVTDGAFIAETIALALIASAETLLCATAVDRLHDGPKTNYDKELRAQGIGNMVCGALGALPATGVIVRSSANVEAGGQTRASAIWHGVWLLALVGFAPFVLALIPTSALAAILVYIGYKLVNVAGMKELLNRGGRSELAIYLATVASIVVFDLLTGVVTGLVLSILKLVFSFARLSVESRSDETTLRSDVVLEGAATFLRLPVLAETLEALPPGHEVHLHIGKLAFIDHACHDVLEAWEKQYTQRGGTVITEWNAVAERRDPSNIFGRDTSTDSDRSGPLPGVGQAA